MKSSPGLKSRVRVHRVNDLFPRVNVDMSRAKGLFVHPMAQFHIVCYGKPPNWTPLTDWRK